jgi:hypothetical protein
MNGQAWFTEPEAADYCRSVLVVLVGVLKRAFLCASCA